MHSGLRFCGDLRDTGQHVSGQKVPIGRSLMLLSLLRAGKERTRRCGEERLEIESLAAQGSQDRLQVRLRVLA